MNLYAHQEAGVAFLTLRNAAMLADEMGIGKTRQALVAAQRLFKAKKIDRMLVLAPAAVRLSWRQEIDVIDEHSSEFMPCVYEPKKQTVYGIGKLAGCNWLPVLLLSYALLPQKRHVEALVEWCKNGKTLLVCDESSFLKNRTAKQTKGSARLAHQCAYTWLLTGTPIANSPLDLYGQSLVMSDGRRGPLSSFRSFYHFRSRYAVLKMMNMGQLRFQNVVGYQNLEELTKRFAPYVLRREKKDCLDLPERTYTVREVALDKGTWAIYQELKKEALLALPNEEVRPEGNAAVRLLRLCQLTSGHVGMQNAPGYEEEENRSRDVSSEKLDYIVEQILEGELANEEALLVWTRWRREHERLQQMLSTKIEVYRIFGDQQAKNRSADIQAFQTSTKRRVMIAQVHAGGYGLTLTAASTAVYLSNSFSYIDRVQSADRIHRIGQKRACLYIDLLACGPAGQSTCDHFVLKTLQEKKSLAEVTCAAWREALE